MALAANNELLPPIIFNGSKHPVAPALRLKEFLGEVVQRRKRYDWSEAKTIQTAISYLRDEAWKWWYNEVQNVSSPAKLRQLEGEWEAFRKAMIARFDREGVFDYAPADEFGPPRPDEDHIDFINRFANVLGMSMQHFRTTCTYGDADMSEPLPEVLTRDSVLAWGRKTQENMAFQAGLDSATGIVKRLIADMTPSTEMRRWCRRQDPKMAWDTFLEKYRAEAKTITKSTKNKNGNGGNGNGKNGHSNGNGARRNGHRIAAADCDSDEEAADFEDAADEDSEIAAARSTRRTNGAKPKRPPPTAQFKKKTTAPKAESFNKSSVPSCSYCKKRGHSKDKCYLFAEYRKGQLSQNEKKQDF